MSKKLDEARLRDLAQYQEGFRTLQGDFVDPRILWKHGHLVCPVCPKNPRYESNQFNVAILFPHIHVGCAHQDCGFSFMMNIQAHFKDDKEHLANSPELYLDSFQHKGEEKLFLPACLKNEFLFCPQCNLNRFVVLFMPPDLAVGCKRCPWEMYVNVSK